MSGGLWPGRGGRFGRRGGARTGAPFGVIGGAADIAPRKRGPITWERPEPALFGLDGRRDLLLKLDATLLNAGDRPLTLLDARLGDQSPAWEAPRAEWYENGDVRRAVFRVEPWLPCTLEPGAVRVGARLVWVVPRATAPARGMARLPLVLAVETLGDLRFDVLAAIPEGFETRR